jgi:hypothetical protein
MKKIKIGLIEKGGGVGEMKVVIENESVKNSHLSGYFYCY